MSGRIRTVKPELNEDDKTASLDDHTWRLFVGMFVLADDYGNMRGAPEWLHGQVFWRFPEKILETRDSLATLSRLSLVTLYQNAGQPYVAITNWDRHQRVDKPGKPRVPGPRDSGSTEQNEDSRVSPEGVAGLQEIPVPRARAQDPDPDHGINDQDPPIAPQGAGDGSELLAQDPVQPPNTDPMAQMRSEILAGADPVVEVFVCWQSEMNHPRSKLDAARRRRIKARLGDGLTKEDLCDAIRGGRRAPWLRGQNSTHTTYDGIHTILRDAEQVEKLRDYFRNEAPPLPTASNQRGPTGLEDTEQW